MPSHYSFKMVEMNGAIGNYRNVNYLKGFSLKQTLCFNQSSPGYKGSSAQRLRRSVRNGNELISHVRREMREECGKG